VPLNFHSRGRIVLCVCVCNVIFPVVASLISHQGKGSLIFVIVESERYAYTASDLISQSRVNLCGNRTVKCWKSTFVMLFCFADVRSQEKAMANGSTVTVHVITGH